MEMSVLAASNVANLIKVIPSWNLSRVKFNVGKFQNDSNLLLMVGLFTAMWKSEMQVTEGWMEIDE